MPPKPTSNPWTRPIYVQTRGDLFEFLFNSHGKLVEIRCFTSRDRCASVLTYEELPDDVRYKYENLYLSRTHIYG